MNKLHTLFSLFLVVALVTACDNNGDNQEIIQVLTENDFANDEMIRADFSENTIIKFLEPPGSDEPENDTGEIGNDIIPVTYNSTVEHTFCWEDEDEDAGHFMELSDSEGSLILRLDTNGECITEIIEAGDYIVTLFHDGLSEDIRPIFLIPNSSNLIDEQQATNQLTHYYRFVKEITLKYLQNSIINDVKAQTVQENINTLLSTNKCNKCNLFEANLRGAKLSGVKLIDANLIDANLNDADLSRAVLLDAKMSGADLSGATLIFTDLEGTNLSGANLSFADLTTAGLGCSNLTGSCGDLTGADLRGAVLRLAQLSGATLTNADLCPTDLSDADLSGSNLTNADLCLSNLTNADLSGSNLSGADLSGSNLSGTNFNGATWCDSTCMCGSNSTGTCVGCPSVEEVCTGN